MDFRVRTPLRFPLGLSGVFLLFASGFALDYAKSGELRPLLFGAWMLLGAVLGVVFVNMPVLTVTPERIVSRMQHRVHKVRLRSWDRLVVRGQELWIRRGTGEWEPVPLNLSLLRESDWDAFEAAVAKRWPPTV